MHQYFRNMRHEAPLRVVGLILGPAGSSRDMQRVRRTHDLRRGEVRRLLEKGDLRIVSAKERTAILEKREAEKLQEKPARPTPPPEPPTAPAKAPVVDAPPPSPEPDPLEEELSGPEVLSLDEFIAIDHTKKMRTYIRSLGIADKISLRGKASMTRDYEKWLSE